MRSPVSLFTTLSLIAFGSATAIDVAPLKTVIGREQPVAYAVNATAREPWQQIIAVPGAKILTLHFSEFSLAEGDVVSLIDSTGAVAAEYTGLGRGDLGDKGGFYSTQVYSSSVTVQYKPAVGTTSAASVRHSFTIDKIVRNSSPASVSAICGESQQLPIKCLINDARLPDAYTTSRAVLRLIYAGQSPCTGWLVGTGGYLLTNNHCMDQGSPNTAANTVYELEAESPTCENTCLTLGSCRGVVAATTAKVIGQDAALDYALVKLNTTLDLSKYGYLKLRVSGPVNNEQIYIPQHPQGRAKEIAYTVDGGDVARITTGVSDSCGAYRVSYTADTQGGSSGSPVIAEKDNHVVGLHSCGAGGEACYNSGVDIRAVIYDMMKKNILPPNALDDPTAPIPTGPWGN